MDMQEEFLVDGQKIFLPPNLAKQPDFLAPTFLKTAWENLPPHIKEHLKSFLPNTPGEESEEFQESTLNCLLDGTVVDVNGRNPVASFKAKMANGHFSPEKVKMRKLVEQSNNRRRKRCSSRAAERQFLLLRDLLRSRHDLLETRLGHSSIPKSVLKLDRKSLRRTMSQSMCQNELETRVTKRYFLELRRIRQEVGDNGDSSEDENYPEGPPPKSSSEDHKEVIHLLDPSWKKEPPKVAPAPPVPTKSQEPKVDMTEEAVANIPGMLEKPPDAKKRKISSPSFFSYLRDTFRSQPDFKMTIPDLMACVDNWQEGASWSSSIPSAIAFLSGSFPNAWPSKDSAYYIECDPSTGHYRWTGAGRDSDLKLSHLTAWWLDRRDICQATTTTGGGHQDYHRQEQQRTSQPDQVFNYKLADGTVSTVGPIGDSWRNLGSCGAKVLTASRPQCVTMPVLTKDAVARLPQGSGTRLEICRLVQQSQFLAPDATAQDLANAVSAALDKLQNEPDPCCKYDPAKKVWVNLHANRTVQDYAATKKTIAAPPTFVTTPMVPEAVVASAVKSILPSEPLPRSDCAQQGQFVQVATPQGMKLYRLPPTTVQKPVVESLLPKEPLPSAKPHSLLLSNNPVAPSASTAVQRVIVKNSDGKPVQISTAALQKLLSSGNIRHNVPFTLPNNTVAATGQSHLQSSPIRMAPPQLKQNVMVSSDTNVLKLLPKCPVQPSALEHRGNQFVVSSSSGTVTSLPGGQIVVQTQAGRPQQQQQPILLSQQPTMQNVHIVRKNK